MLLPIRLRAAFAAAAASAVLMLGAQLGLQLGFASAASADASASPATSGSAGGTAAAGGALISESFTEANGALPAGWTLMTYYSTGISSAQTVSDPTDTAEPHYLKITSKSENHARTEVTVALNPNTTYLWHALAKASGVHSGRAGAVLGVDGQTTTSNSVTTNTSWQPVDLYVKVGAAAAGATEVSMTFTMGLGNYGSLDTGTAQFAAASLTQVTTIASGASVLDLSSVGASAASSSSSAAAVAPVEGNPSSMIYFLAAAIVIGGFVLYLVLRREQDAAHLDRS